MKTKTETQQKGIRQSCCECGEDCYITRARALKTDIPYYCETCKTLKKDKQDTDDYVFFR